MINLSEASARFLYIYLGEFILGLVLFFIFRHFGKLYRRKFLYTWSLSWLFFAVYMISTGTILVFIISKSSPLRNLFSVAAQLTCFLQVIFILRGTYELIKEKAVNRRKFNMILFIAAIVAVVSVLAFMNDPSAASYRHLMRTGARTFATATGFMMTGVLVLTNKKFSKGFGQRLLATSFVIYSLYQSYYLFIVIADSVGMNVKIPSVYGIVDLLLISLMGMGMVMWLLEDEREKLSRANKELDSFLYSTSHDLRAPIASILGLTYLGKLEFEEERAKMFMTMIEERVKKLDLVIGDILSLSRSKKLDIKIEKLSLENLIKEVITDIRFSKGVSAITLMYEPDPSHEFASDYNQIKIILNNLLSNAVKYHNIAQANPYIKIGFIRNKDRVQISIEDNGQGIPQESLPRIFEMFFRASLESEGTGLGLYIVQEAVNKIKGEIEVKSELGKGSTFTIKLENA